MPTWFNRWIFALLSCAALASGPASAQILPPTAGQPDSVLQPPVAFPPTTATSAVGSYFVAAALDQGLATNVRFVILTNLSRHAILDRETGLVWARMVAPNRVAPSELAMTWRDADRACRELVVGNRGGWRLPTIQELQSLVDGTVPVSDLPRLPAGHPFALSLGSQSASDLTLWTSDIFFEADDPDEATSGLVSLRSGGYGANFQSARFRALCVRGPQ
jgi:hypothetical protein